MVIACCSNAEPESQKRKCENTSIGGQKKLCPWPFTSKLQPIKMKLRLSLFAFFISTVLLATAENYQSVSAFPPPPQREFRGAWIATVGNMDWPSAPGLSVAQQKAELISLLDMAVRTKLNTVVFQIRPASDAMYASSIEPWSEYLTGVQGQAPQPYFDPLAFAVEEAHRRGLELHAWMNPFRVRLSTTTPAAANHVSHTHREWVHAYGGQLWLDPGEPAARAYVLQVIMDVVRRYDVDGIQFDDYFYPYPAAGSQGNRLPFPDDVTWRKYGSGSGFNRDDWRRHNIDEFIQSVYQNIKATKPWVKFGVSPFGIWRPGSPPQVKGFDAYAGLYADSRLWLANGWVDYFSPQLYWPINSPGQSFPVLLNWWEHQNAKNRNLWPGLAAYVAGSKFPVQEIGQQIQVLRTQPGASGEIFFHLRTFDQNPALANVVAALYTQTALVPASPWLVPALPPKPEITEHDSNGGWTFQWTAPGGTSTAKWVVQFCGVDNVWRTAILPANQLAQTFSFAPQMVSIRAMDRAENLSPPAVIGKARATVKQPSGSSNSFWGSYPKH